MKRSTGLPLWGPTLLLLAAVLLPGPLRAANNFVYTNNDRPTNRVSGFSVASDGTLTPLAGSPFTTGGSGGAGLYASNRIGVAIVGNFLFASNAVSNDVSVFAIDPSTGALTLVAGSPFPTGGSSGFPSGLAVASTPDGRFLMAANSGSSKITVFSIASTGALTPVAGSPFFTLSTPDGIKVSPDGKFLAVAEYLANLVEMFSIAASGALTSLGGFAGGGGSQSGQLAGVDIDCSTGFLYGAEANPGNTIVDAYSIASNGTLTPLTGSPFIPGVGDNSNVVLLSSDDKTLFVSNQFSHTITVFSVASDGSLSPVPGSPFPMNGGAITPTAMATSQDGTLLYVADYSIGAVSVFSVASTGVLTEVTGSPFSTGQGTALESLTAFPPKACLQTVAVEIMIKPTAAPPVPINPKAKGKIPVAILSTPTFNALTQVAPSSLTFGHTGTEASLAFCGAGGEDVNGDGLLDLVCHFNSQQTGLVAGDTLAILEGTTVAGIKLTGSEAIRTVPH